MAENGPRNTISTSPGDSAGRRRVASTPRRRSGGDGGGGSRLFGNVVLAVLIAGLAVAGWFIAEQHQSLQRETSALAEAESRLKVLEDRLRVTDAAMTESGEATSEQINFWESEIRKLWDVSNVRNKKWIEDNQKAIADVRKVIATLEATSSDIKGTLGRHESAFARQQEVIDQITSVEIQLQQVSRSQRDLVERVNKAQQTMAQLQSGLVNRVNENEQAVTAIDAYRLQLNSRLADIERRLDSLSGSPSL